MHAIVISHARTFDVLELQYTFENIYRLPDYGNDFRFHIAMPVLVSNIFSS